MYSNRVDYSAWGEGLILAVIPNTHPVGCCLAVWFFKCFYWVVCIMFPAKLRFTIYLNLRLTWFVIAHFFAELCIQTLPHFGRNLKPKTRLDPFKRKTRADEQI